MVRNWEGSRGLATASGIPVRAGEGTACSGPRGLPSSRCPRARCAHPAQQHGVGVPGAPPAPAGKLAHREICASFPSSPGSCAQASTSAASLSLLRFAINHVLSAEVDKRSEKNPSFHPAHASCAVVQHTERDLVLRPHHQKVSASSLGKTRD